MKLSALKPVLSYSSVAARCHLPISPEIIHKLTTKTRPELNSQITEVSQKTEVVGRSMEKSPSAISCSAEKIQ